MPSCHVLLIYLTWCTKFWIFNHALTGGAGAPAWTRTWAMHVGARMAANILHGPELTPKSTHKSQTVYVQL